MSKTDSVCLNFALKDRLNRTREMKLIHIAQMLDYIRNYKNGITTKQEKGFCPGTRAIVKSLHYTHWLRS